MPDTPRFRLPFAFAAGAVMAFSAQAQAQAQTPKCPVTHDQLVNALKQSVKASGGPSNGGLPVNEWAAVVNRHGVVCAVAYSGKKATSQWPGSRAIAVEKANTVNGFGLDKYAISTANLYAQAQPGGFLYGTYLGNPPVAKELYAGKATDYGTKNDPLIGKKPGGVIVFGGGLGLYNKRGIVGGLGASGNTSCADHNIAWRVRKKLDLDHVPNGPSPQHNDEIIYDIGKNGKSESGWGHPECGHNAPQIAQKIGAGIVKVAQGGKTPSATQGAGPAEQQQGTGPSKGQSADQDQAGQTNSSLTPQKTPAHESTLPKSVR